MKAAERTPHSPISFSKAIWRTHGDELNQDLVLVYQRMLDVTQIECCLQDLAIFGYEMNDLPFVACRICAVECFGIRDCDLSP